MQRVESDKEEYNKFLDKLENLKYIILTGPNGCGKSVFLKQLTDFLEKGNRFPIYLSFGNKNIENENRTNIESNHFNLQSKNSNYSIYNLDVHLDEEILLDRLKYACEYFQKNNTIEQFNFQETRYKLSVDESNHFKINDTHIAKLSKEILFFYNSLISKYFENKENNFDNWYKKIKNGMFTDDFKTEVNILKYLFEIDLNYELIDDLNTHLESSKFKYKLNRLNKKFLFSVNPLPVKFLCNKIEIGLYDLSSGERFIFWGLLLQFISIKVNEKKIKINQDAKIFLLLDEPDSHLHQSAIEEFMEIIKNDLKCLNIKVVLSTHNIMTVCFFDEENIFCLEMGEEENVKKRRIDEAELINPSSQSQLVPTKPTINNAREHYYKLEFKNYEYSRANQMLTNNLYMSFRKGKLDNPSLYDDLILQIYKNQSSSAVGDSMESLFRVYLQHEKDKRFEFLSETIEFKGKSEDIEFKQTRTKLNKIVLEDYMNDTKKAYILWPPESNPSFDFLTITDKKIGLFQIKISEEIDKYLKKTFDSTFEIEYKDMINQSNQVEYFFIHGNCEIKYENEKNHPLNYDENVPNSGINEGKKPVSAHLYSTHFLGKKIFKSKFMQNFNQFEVKLMKYFKNPEKLTRFLELLELDPLAKLDLNNHFREEDINELQKNEISEKYTIVYKKNVEKPDFEFFILNNQNSFYFYATNEKYSDDYLQDYKQKYCKFLENSLSNPKKYVIAVKEDTKLIETDEVNKVKIISKNILMRKLKIKCQCTGKYEHKKCSCKYDEIKCYSTLCHKGINNCSNRSNIT